jgi:hypothetical protein
MKRFRVLVAGLAAAPAGCFSARPSAPESFVWQAARNAVQQPVKHHDDKAFIKAVRRHAEDAYDQACRAAGRWHHGPYRDGFVDGYIDFVEAGGSGEPPFLPPFRYRLTRNRTPEGVAAADAWYAGFRHGAAAARASGLRELNYVPLPAPPVPAAARADGPPPEVPPAAGRSPWEVPGTVAPARPPAPPPIPPADLPLPRAVPPLPQPTPIPPAPGR